MRLRLQVFRMLVGSELRWGGGWIAAAPFVLIAELMAIFTGLGVRTGAAIDSLISELLLPLIFLPFIAMLTAMTLVQQNWTSKTHYLLLSLPVRAFAVLGARLLAIAAILMGITLLAFGTAAVVVGSKLGSAGLVLAGRPFIDGAVTTALRFPSFLTLASVALVGTLGWQALENAAPVVRGVLRVLIALLGTVLIGVVPLGSVVWFFGYTERTYTVLPLDVGVFLASLVLLPVFLTIAAFLWDSYVEA